MDSRRCDSTLSRRQVLGTCGGLVAASGLAGCSLSASPHTAVVGVSFEPGPADELVVETDAGDVSLAPGDEEGVSGRVRKESPASEDALAQMSVRGQVEDGKLIVASHRSDSSVDVSANFDLAVSDDMAVVEVTTGDGDVSAEGVSGDGTYRSSNGDVIVEDVDGYVTVESTNGDVTASGTTGLAGATTTNGDVSVDVLDVRSDVTCESTNGDVTVAVSEDLGASVRLRTNAGDASVEGVSLSDAETSDSRIAGRLGAGDHTLELVSKNGDVTLIGR